jgi:hypothetical protein
VDSDINKEIEHKNSNLHGFLFKAVGICCLLLLSMVDHQALCQGIDFSPAANFGIHTGAYPIAVAVGDVTGDGKPDIVAANYNSNEVSILTGKGDGTFYPVISFTVATHPISVAIGDINHDNKPEIITANYLTQNISVLRQVQDSAFELVGNYTLTHGVSQYPMSVAIGDANGDGHPDVITGNEISNDISVLLGNGDCTFRPPVNQTVSLSEHLYAIAVGDVNGDEKLDIAVANDGFSNVAVLLGYGDSTFHSPAYFGTFTRSRSVVICDLNNDGSPELITANSDQNKIAVYHGNGNGTFASAVSYSVDKNPTSVASADLNGDGKPDVVTANYDSNSVSVLAGNGDGTLQETNKFSVGTAPNSVAIADVNNDGKPDLVTANYTNQNVSVLLNTTVFPPHFHVSTTTLDFGSLSVVDNKTDSIPVSNTGIDASLVISSASSDSPEFSVSPSLDTIPDSSTHYFSINFHPVNGGLRTGHIIFVHDGSTSPDTITVSGISLPGISISNAGIPEGNIGITPLNFAVRLSPASPDTVKLHFITEDGTAAARHDFESDSGEIVFNPGDTMKTVPVHILADTVFEADETCKMKLSNPVNAFIADSQGIGTILNDDSLHIDLHAKWNIVSVPLTVSDYRKSILFPNASSAAYSYQAGYVQQDMLANGVGYWIKVNTAQIVRLPGSAREHDTISVTSGWNLIGSTSFPIPGASIESIPAGLIASSIFEYSEKGYVSADTIKPGSGYWVKANQDGILIFSTSSLLIFKNGIRVIPKVK